MRRENKTIAFAVTAALCTLGLEVLAWEPLPVENDPLVRMPGTQPADGIALRDSGTCFNCHSNYDPKVEPGTHWKGSMMAMATRDPLFWATLTVSAQDSIWLLGRPNATDLCIRCHSPAGWLQGHSDPTNGSLLVAEDHDGIECVACHRGVNPFFRDLDDGTREGGDWHTYWDETWVSGTPADVAAAEMLAADLVVVAPLSLYNGDPAFDAQGYPSQTAWDEAGAGQYFVDSADIRRAPFADAAARHGMYYSRFHRSRYFCNTCHDVSNPALANYEFEGQLPGTGTALPSESLPAYAYAHVERTFSEFMLSDYGVGNGSAGVGPYHPDVFDTSQPGNLINSCQSCHMPYAAGKGCDKNDGVNRPSGSVEHPSTGQPVHEFTGGNIWLTRVLSSVEPASPIHDPTNEALLKQGASVLTLDFTQGLPLDPNALLDGANRALEMIQLSASLQNGGYESGDGTLSFRIQNNTGHRLPSGYPEGRRIFINVKAYSGGNLIWEVNPYDTTAHTLRGLPDAPGSPSLGPNEVYDDELVFEMHTGSSLTGEAHTFHFVLADKRNKDNRIPPKGYRIAEAAERVSVPVDHGTEDPSFFTDQEYAGGYDDRQLTIASGADRVEVRLYYQVTSREFVEFLRDEISGTGNTTLGDPPSGEANAYVAQTDPFFAGLKAWGETIWQLWVNTADWPGAAPVMVDELIIEQPCTPVTELCDDVDNDCDGDTDEDWPALGDPCAVGLGECRVEGSVSCNAGRDGVRCDGQPGTPVTELCDALDNDCDGDTDEDFPGLGGPCTEGLGECISSGWWICSADQLAVECSAEPAAPQPEACDGLDNDCNGTPDDGCDCIDDETQDCYTGPVGTLDVGPCRGGTQTCVLGAWGDCQGEVLPQAESCDLADNDCDGQTDEAVTNACGSCGPVPTETCDGKDEDCDGLTDEDFPGLGEACRDGLGECLNLGVIVCAGAGVQCDATAGTPVGELCDSLDNDCDGQTDESFPEVGTPCVEGVGECAAAGKWVCREDKQGTECSSEPGTGSEELCDGLDNDCDGFTDEDFVDLGQPCSVGRGECTAQGQMVCNELQDGTECDGVPGQSEAELCDGLDNDCDGVVDNGCDCIDGQILNCYSGPNGTAGVGECAAGTALCADGAFGACNGEVLPQGELCDDLDNDCDGRTDEDFASLGYLCVSGQGECAWAGVYVCRGEKTGVECDAAPGTGSAELCDGADNDCDGQTDEDWPSLGAGCVEGLGECAASGAFVCNGGGDGVKCSSEPGTGSAELCDGLDNDCDGQTDEPFPGLGKNCTVGTGECAATGSWICSPDGLYEECNTGAGDPGLEKCNGLDDDCDGQTDEGFRAGEPCNDGNPCTRGDVYDASCGCAGTPYVCEPEMCEASSTCDGLGGCTVVLDAPGTPCDDGDPLTVQDECAEDGSCFGVPDTDTETGAEDTDTGTEDTDTETETETVTGSDTDTDTETGAEDTDTGTEETDTETETVTESDTDTESADSETDAGVDEISGGNDGCGCRATGTRSRGARLWRVLWQISEWAR